MSLYLGIDFGTSTNLVIQWDNEKKLPKQTNGLGSYGKSGVFPNVIYYEPNGGNPIVGELAIDKAKSDPYNYVDGIKRHIGEKNFRQDIPNLGKKLTSEDIAKDIFTWIKNKIEDSKGGEKIDGVVISVPFAFQHMEKERIKNAAINAGLNVIGLIEEPVAAALTYGLHTNVSKTKETILVFDLGGGTLDITIFDFIKKAEDRFAVYVVGTAGDKKLGGRDVDELIFNKLVHILKQKYPDFEENRIDLLDIAKQAQDIKLDLSYDNDCVFTFESYKKDNCKLDEDIGTELLNDTLSKNGFLDKIKNILDDLIFEMEDNDVKFCKENIDKILLVGGSSNLEAVQDLLTDYFGKKPQKLNGVEMDELVGIGAAIYCGILLDNKIKYTVRSCVSHSIGIKKNGKFIPMLQRNTKYEEESTKEQISLKNFELDIYQYIGKPMSIGKVYIDQNKLNDISNVFLSLTTDKSGLVQYILYDKDNNLIEKNFIKGAK